MANSSGHTIAISSRAGLREGGTASGQDYGCGGITSLVCLDTLYSAIFNLYAGYPHIGVPFDSVGSQVLLEGFDDVPGVVRSGEDSTTALGLSLHAVTPQEVE